MATRNGFGGLHSMLW